MTQKGYDNNGLLVNVINYCRWMLSRRARDMGIISDSGAFSADGLAYSIFLRKE
jgi:hypothetical protein